ncbi:uncharacterized protein LOC109909341 [Oncorhynchus kisutch]|uniref:uncharacterized protein LOC109909341 n=1 Tax=Oncorhynchus kisutch TaxID=8019 RepID=UPI0012DED506|nr:uncharacterized protein LOC109909341 [Oncorhynchus kisutch]
MEWLCFLQSFHHKSRECQTLMTKFDDKICLQRTAASPSQDSETCTDLQKQHEVIHAAVGEPLVLNCTYNCSSGFVHGHWVKLSDCPHCPRPRETKNVTKNGDLCTLPLYFPHLSREDFQYNYTCFSEDHESEQFPRKIECLVSLQAQARPSAPDTTDTTDESLTALGNHEDSIIDHGKPAVICTGTTSREGSGACSTNCERVALRITPADCQSDHEVPYADIMITMRGASTPELTQISYLALGDHRERWREEAGPGPSTGPEARSHLQASRSADRLHVQPLEFFKEDEQNSEYAGITYS